MQKELRELDKKLAGIVCVDRPVLAAYATDASIYQQMPTAVAFPGVADDIPLLIEFAIKNGVGLIPRTAGTSLAGQVVGNGIVVDTSRFLTKILNVELESRTVTVQPGVIRDDLNHQLRSHRIHFAPETSTSNRAMIGGMLGNNSCGANSIVYGTTRDHVVEVAGYLSDGSFARFGPINEPELNKILGTNTEFGPGKIYKDIIKLLSKPDNQSAIHADFPAPAVKRRNTGYAIDALLKMKPFGGNAPLNLAKLIAGSEGTLFFASEIKLGCVDLPPKNSRLICAHFNNVYQSLMATRIAMQYAPTRCELIDHLVVEGAQRNRLLKQKTGFITGNPKAILMIEFRNDDAALLDSAAAKLVDELKQEKLGYEFPILSGSELDAAWQVRKSGLGVVNNVAGDKKPVALIEDAAVPIDSLPDYVRAVDELLSTQHHICCAYYGHAGAGELHIRPELNLKQQSDRDRLRAIATGVAEIVKKFGGSLSGEHGDGRLRSELIRFMLGDQCYDLIRQIKRTWDPNNVFNPGKIVDAPRLDVDLRCNHAIPKQPKQLFNFSESGSLLASVELCSGSGDCRKTHLSGGTMCPSYMATRNEYDSTRARANILRDFLTRPDVNDAFADLESVNDAKDVLQLCLSCKGCKTECPSNVDMAKIKAEFMHAYHQIIRPSLTTRCVADFEKTCQLLARIPLASRFLDGRIGVGLRHFAKIDSRRSLPALVKLNLRKRLRGFNQPSTKTYKKEVLFFIDEFSNWLDVEIGFAAITLLDRLGYQIKIVEHKESGRSAISMGLPEKAKGFAEFNVRKFAPLIRNGRILVGVEPSALLTLRDEYPDLVTETLRTDAQLLADNSFLIDEFLFEEFQAGRLDSSIFKGQELSVLLHGHCHQKALGSMANLKTLLEYIPGCNVKMLDSGCCGMAGFFGYQSDNYDLSMQIGELVLFPSIRKSREETIVVANGTSCRHQIADGTGRIAKHAVEVLAQCVK